MPEMNLDNTWKSTASKLLPFHDLGQTVLIISYLSFIVMAFHSNKSLMYYLLVFSIAGILISNIGLGLWSASAIMSASDFIRAREVLSLEPKIVEIRANCWAPRRYTSWVWNSSWLSITKDGDNFRVQARERDLQFLQRKMMLAS